MPLIIAVLAIIVIFVVMHDNKIVEGREDANCANAIRKTNSYLERKTLDHFLRQGLPFDDAFQKTVERMVEMGYDPCIPKNKYGTNHFGRQMWEITPVETSYIETPERFDSSVVKDRVKILKEQGKPLNEKTIYGNFPTNKYEYHRELKKSSLYYRSIPIGEWITYPGVGTCEIVEHVINPITETSGWYRVKQLKTGKIYSIKIGDSKITRL